MRLYTEANLSDILMEQNDNIYKNEDDIKIVYIYRIFSVLFIITGTICNILSAIVYSKRKMLTKSYSIYLLVLALVDLSVTWIGNTRFILMFFKIGYSNKFNLWYGFDIREISLISCRLHRFLTYFLLQFSSCLLCMLNIDRFIGCVLVLKSTSYCKASIAKRIVFITCLFLALINLHFLLAMGYYENSIDNTEIRVVCQPNPLNKAYLTFWNIYVWIDSIIYAIIPFIIMIFCNICLIIKIIKSRIESNKVIHTRIALTRGLSNVATILPSEKRLTLILIGISISFLCLTMPISILEGFSNYFNTISYSYFIAISYMLMYANHVINFFFYCALGPKFRNEVKNLLPCRWLRRNKIVPYTPSSNRVPKNYSIEKLVKSFHPIVIDGRTHALNPFITEKIQMV